MVVLNCTENMDNGKTTYDYFSTIPRIFADEPYNYIGKADDNMHYNYISKTDDNMHYSLAALADMVMRWGGTGVGYESLDLNPKVKIM
jgi:hypothetical protein